MFLLRFYSDRPLRFAQQCITVLDCVRQNLGTNFKLAPRSRLLRNGDYVLIETGPHHYEYGKAIIFITQGFIGTPVAEIAQPGITMHN